MIHYFWTRPVTKHKPPVQPVSHFSSAASKNRWENVYNRQHWRFLVVSECWMLILLGKCCLWISSKCDPRMSKYKNTRIHKNTHQKWKLKNKTKSKQIERLSTHIWIQTKWDAVFGEVKLDNRSLSVLSLLTSYFKKTFNMCLLQYRIFLEGKYNFLIWVLEQPAKWIALVRSGCSGALLVFFNWEIIGQNVEINVKQYVRVSFLILSGCYEKFLALTLAALAN